MSHNGTERKWSTLAGVFQPYWHPQCEIRTVLDIMIFTLPASVLVRWLIHPSWPNIAATYLIHFPTWKSIC